MSENIKITMLGTTGAGKTCFMVGMYAVMQLGVHGFTLSAQDMDDDIDLTDNWERLTEGGEGRFPAATSDTYNFCFNFCYGFKKLMGFEWLDYRGGALRDKASQSDVQTLQKTLNQSSCVFMCISGEHLANKIENSSEALNLAKKTRADRMNFFLNQLHEEQGPVPVVIAITKYDLCMHRKRDDIKEDIKKLFNPLFTEDGGWLVAICPVSLGKGLAGDKNTGNIEPINLHLPLAFAIYVQLSLQFLQLGDYEKQESEKMTVLRNKFLGSWWYNNEIKEAEKRLSEIKAYGNDLQVKMNFLTRELGRIPVYFNGQEQEINV
ncbi:MAG: hypothetical protein KME64_04125 [Scytonematopsis contorta HA4267-MV1]|jgi:hypothetical protein|nr:hypothetical protein [Scytonematopsis contorta HA4267-MV1]